MVTNDHEKAAYLVDARIKGKGERKFFDVRDELDTSRVIFARNVLFVTEVSIDNNSNTIPLTLVAALRARNLDGFFSGHGRGFEPERSRPRSS
jgi:hypothetical protein